MLRPALRHGVNGALKSFPRVREHLDFSRGLRLAYHSISLRPAHQPCLRTSSAPRNPSRLAYGEIEFTVCRNAGVALNFLGPFLTTVYQTRESAARVDFAQTIIPRMQ
jgi:hypothetical protein